VGLLFCVIASAIDRECWRSSLCPPVLPSARPMVPCPSSTSRRDQKVTRETAGASAPGCPACARLTQPSSVSPPGPLPVLVSSDCAAVLLICVCPAVKMVISAFCSGSVVG
jgi:hypothetical protein